MGLLNRVRVSWSGSCIVGASCTTLYYDASGGAVPNVASISTAFGSIYTSLPSSVTLTIPSSGDVIDSATGQLQSTWTAAGAQTVTGNDNGNVAAGVGACVTLDTGGVENGRRVRGRIFVVPLPVSSYDTTGTLNNALLGPLKGLGDKLIAAGPLMIWHRPTTALPGTGGAFLVTGARVADRVSVLRSRRY